VFIEAILGLRTMQALLEHRLGLNRLELGSEISQSLGAAV
jgi:hypothetical protein